MRLPFDGSYRVTTEFGVKDSIYANYPDSRHPGIDWGLPLETPARAVMSGRTNRIVWPEGTRKGNELVIENGNLKAGYGHLSRFLAGSGAWVNEGDVIGFSGNTGFSKGPHLHFEFLVNGQYVDFLKYLEEHKGEDMVDEVLLDVLYDIGLHRASDQLARDTWIGKTPLEVARGIRTSPEHAKLRAKAASGTAPTELKPGIYQVKG